MPLRLIPSSSRGLTSAGWLVSRHSFSFANYYNPERMNFGTLRVINDDLIMPGTGFGAHAHDNMEIITVMLEGALKHSDSLGNEAIIQAGDVQTMSAGTGVTHSEMNASHETATKLLQIWIETAEHNREPFYDQKSIPHEADGIITLAGPEAPDAEYAVIHQQAWISLVRLHAHQGASYALQNTKHGVYLQMIEGEITLADQLLRAGDAAELTDESSITISAVSTAKLLLIEVPMK